MAARVMVIGGGVTGLSFAHHLAERCSSEKFPLEVLLVESKDRLGGVIETLHQDGFLFEGASDSFITEKPWALNLCQRLGLSHQLIETNPSARRSFVVFRGKLVPVPEGFYLLAPSRFWPFVTSRFLSPMGKLRVMCEWSLPKKENLQDESVASFVRRRFGDEAYRRIAQPMVSSVYAGDPEALSMRATLPRFIEMENQYGSILRALKARNPSASGAQDASGPRYGLFLSFRNGMQTLIDRLAESLPQKSIRLRTKVIHLKSSPEDHGWEVVFSDQTRLKANAICLAIPAFQAATLLQGVDPGLSERLGQIPYHSSATLNLAYRRQDIPHPLNGFGFVVPAVERHPILGCSFNSVKFPGRAPEGKALLRVFVAGDETLPMGYLSDEELKIRVCQSLKRLLDITAHPQFSLLTRSPRSMPQYQVGHLERVKKIMERLQAYPGLTLAGNAYDGIGVPDCIHSGEAAADRLFAELKENVGQHDSVFRRPHSVKSI